VTTGSTTGVVVPIRAFAGGKARLAARLSPAERTALLESMATSVVDAAKPRGVLVVSSAPEVVAWALGRGVAVIADPGSLDAAATAGRDWWLERGAERVIVLHADLPDARSLDTVDPSGHSPVVRAVACHRADGTNVLSVPASEPFIFAYGPGSFARHRREADRIGLAFVAVDDPALAFDIDTPDDLDARATRGPAPSPMH
jgi:2-phospho-L-lactate/phosphoenolpyruvate guanylyltransferase